MRAEAMPEYTFELDEAVHVRLDWRAVSSDKWKCGDIEIRRTAVRRWNYFIKIKGRFRKAFPKSRLYGYGTASQAKVGFSKIRLFVYE